ncbi:hypothetical protein MHYP_G00102970 [Metynnis hypsauchen]
MKWSHCGTGDPPKSVSVSISPSGEIVECSSVTLTCSSDGNPPVKIYIWFKEGGTSPVGSRNRYSIISITADHTGLYYCEAQNDHGALNGTVMVSVKSGTVGPVFGGCHCEKAVQSSSPDDTYTALDPQSNSPDDLYTALDPQSRSPEYDTLATVKNQH